MTKNTANKPLALRKTGLRVLNDEQITQVGGAIYEGWSDDCQTNWCVTQNNCHSPACNTGSATCYPTLYQTPLCAPEYWC